MSPLIIQLRGVRRRLALLRWFMYALDGVTWAAGIAFGWLVLTRLFPFLGDALWGAVVAGTIAFASVTVLAIRRWPSLTDAALAADDRLGLKERLTSSLELADASGPMIEAVHRDAQRHLAQLAPRRDFPLLPRKSLRWVAIPLALFGLGYVLIPEFDITRYKERTLEAKVKEIKRNEQARRVMDAARILKPPPEKPESAQGEAAKQLELVAEELRQGNITEKQAAVRLEKLQDTLAAEREKLQQKQMTPRSPADPEKLGVAKEIAKKLEEGKPAEAAKALRELQQQLRDGKLSEEQKQALAKDLKSLSEQMNSDAKPADEALQKALEAAQNGNAEAQKNMDDAMQQMEMSLEDTASAMEQLAQIESAMAQMSECQQKAMGQSPFCRSCGKKLSESEKKSSCKNGGKCGACAGNKSCNSQGQGQCQGQGQGGNGKGPGMGGSGQGEGNRVGDLPDLQVGFSPAMLSGGMTQGKMLANISQKAAPETGVEATVEYAEGTFIEARQEAENALTKEEIPSGSKEFVRQYFSAIEPQRQSATANEMPAGQ